MLKRLFVVVVAFAAGVVQAQQVGTAPLWETSGFHNPESVLYDAKRHLIFVSNVDGQPTDKDAKGSIALLSSSGKMINPAWQKGLNAPKGLAMVEEYLYVADIDRLLVFDVMNGKQIAEFVAPEAKFLNDVAADGEGRIYVSDMLDNAIYRLSDGEFSLWLKDEDLQSPNGLHVENGKLIVGAWGVMTDGFTTAVPGHLKVVALDTKMISSLGSGKAVGNLDGVEADGKGNYFASDWLAGSLFRISPSGEFEKLLDLEQGSADIGVIPEQNLVLVPMMNNGTVRAYRVE